MVRAPALDGLRGIAAVAIVALHAWLYTTTAAQKEDSTLDAIAHQLRLGVPLFFCLSGFLLYRAWVVALRDGARPPRLRTYAGRRARRILPGYAAALAGSLVLLLPLTQVRGVNIPDASLLPLFAVFASNLHPDTVGALNAPMWTLAVEVQFYLVLPLLAAASVWLGRRHWSGLLLAPAVLLVVGTAFNVYAAGRPGSLVAATSLPALAPVFACGAAAAVLADRRRLQQRWVLAVLATVGVALVILNGAWHEAGAGGAGLVVRDLPAAVGFAAIVLACLGARGPLASRPLVTLGSLSFAVYLWHMPLMLALRGAGLFPEGQPVAAFLAVLAVTLPVAWLSWRFVEQPWLTRRPDPAVARPGSSRLAPKALPLSWKPAEPRGVPKVCDADERLPHRHDPAGPRRPADAGDDATAPDGRRPDDAVRRRVPTGRAAPAGPRPRPA